MNKEIVEKRQLLRSSLRLLNALTTLNVWHFIWISIVLSEVLTSLMGLLLKGSVTYDYLVTGGVVSLIVAGIVIFFLKVTMQVKVDNEILRTEIEKQRETTEGLTKALDFQSLLMETIPDLLYVLNPVGQLIKWNGLAEETTGYSHDDLAGKQALTFIVEQDRDEAAAGLEEAYLKGRATRELRLLTKDGKNVVHLFSGAAIRDNTGRLVGFIGVARDISKMKKMEEEMTRIKKLESLGILASGIAHDFNFLLSSTLENIHLSIIHADQKERQRGGPF
jgi:PAS domain S-box-containing protein